MLCWKCKEYWEGIIPESFLWIHCHHNEPEEKPKGEPFVELASVGYPKMEGIRLRFKNGTGQWIRSQDLKKNPQKVIAWINDWIKSFHA